LIALLTATTLTALLFGSVMTLQDVRASRPWMDHARRVQGALIVIRSALVDAEASQRGFLLDGDAESLEPFKNAEASLPPALADLKRLVADDEELTRRSAAELERLVSDKMAEIRQTIDLQGRGEAKAALDIARGDASKAAMGSVRRLISDMREREDKLLAKRTAAIRADFDRAIWIEAGAGIGLVALGFILLAIHRDIARREVLENALREQAAFQERFIGILGHDLRNPLGAISLAAAHLRRSALPPPQSEMVKRLESSAARMGRMIEQLLDVTRARLGDGIPVEAKAGTDLSEIVRAAVDELRAIHPQAHIEVQADRICGHWDPDRLSQVVSNLVTNAIHYGQGAIDVRVRRTEASAALEVRNDGRPIPEDVLPRIFEPFRRASKSENGSRGLGLGLFIAERIVVAHGGTIDVRSSQAQGTTFTISLPIAREGEERVIAATT
jgi:signal transduction histidine kinase